MSDAVVLARKRVFRPDEVARFLRVSRATVYRMVEAGSIPVVSDVRPYRIPSAAVKSRPDESDERARIDAITAKRMLRPDEVCEVLGWSLSTVYARLKAGRIPSIAGEKPYRIPGVWLRKTLCGEGDA